VENTIYNKFKDSKTENDNVNVSK